MKLYTSFKFLLENMVT